MTRGKVQVTFDCADPVSLGTFWAEALGYPRPDIERWHEHLRGDGVDEAELNNWFLIDDPTGVGPRLFFQKVPEPKIVKNRVHLDVRISFEAPSDRPTIDAEVERLVALGAQKVRSTIDGDSYYVVLQDPEGNEFCVD